MDKVTQQTAANAEEIASSTEELSAQSIAMQDVVRQIRDLVRGAGDGGHQAAAAPRAAKRPAATRRGTPRAALSAPSGSVTARKSAPNRSQSRPASKGSAEDVFPMEDNDMNSF
jgi:methyl-accepting chemotaxis protein